MLLAVVSAAIESVAQVDEYAAWRKWMTMWMNMDEYAGKGKSRNHWSRQDERQARTGKDESSKY